MPSSVTQAEQPPSAAGQGSNKFIFEDFTIWCAISVTSRTEVEGDRMMFPMEALSSSMLAWF